MLKLVVDNPANEHTAGSGEKTVPGVDHAQSLRAYRDRVTRRAVQRSHPRVMRPDPRPVGGQLMMPIPLRCPSSVRAP